MEVVSMVQQARFPNEIVTMKKLLFVLLLLGSCQTKPTVPEIETPATDTKFMMTEGILFFNHKPYSGFVIEKYPNEKWASKSGYLNGKLEGKQEKWFENGQQQELRFYTDNHKVGKHEGWYSTGQKRFEYFIENDIPIKTQQEWYANGQRYTAFSYNNEGQPEGTQQMWFENGQIKANYVIKNGRRFGLLGAKGCMGENEKKQTQLKL
jgi:antitoxin component YwqK of YwqJK toxin-antitoxin module